MDDKTHKKKIAELRYSTMSLLQTPIAMNIRKLLLLPPHILQRYPDSHDSAEFEISHSTCESDHRPPTLEIVASITKRGHAESYDECATRCAYNISNLLNSYVIPVFLLRILTKHDEGLTGLSPYWSRVISITCRSHHNNYSPSEYTFDILKLILHKKLLSNSECKEFLFVSSEYIRQVILSSEHRARKFSFHISLAHEVAMETSSFLYSFSYTGLKAIAQSLQLLPIYRSLLKSSTEDYGITRAPYNLGVICVLKSTLETQKTTTRSFNRPSLIQQCSGWIYVYGKKAEILPDDTFYIAPRSAKMDMLALFEVDPRRLENAEQPSQYIFPVICVEKVTLGHFKELEQNLKARDIVLANADARENRCTVINLKPNPQATAACTAESMAFYLQLLTLSCKSLLGLNFQTMAYASTVQRVDQSKQNHKVLHILDVGTKPKECSDTTLYDKNMLLVYDEARKNLSGDRLDSPAAEEQSMQALTSTVSCLLSETSEIYPATGLTRILEYLHMRLPDLGHFLMSDKMAFTAVIQEHGNNQLVSVRAEQPGRTAENIPETCLSASAILITDTIDEDAGTTPDMSQSMPLCDLPPDSAFAPEHTSTPIAGKNSRVLGSNIPKPPAARCNDDRSSPTPLELISSVPAHANAAHADSSAANTTQVNHQETLEINDDNTLEMIDSSNMREHVIPDQVGKRAPCVFMKTTYIYLFFSTISVCLYIFVFRSSIAVQYLHKYDIAFGCGLLVMAALFFSVAYVCHFRAARKITRDIVKDIEESCTDTAEATTNNMSHIPSQQQNIPTAPEELELSPSVVVAENALSLPAKESLARSSSTQVAM